MNKIFKVIWSKSKQCYIVVSEMAKNHSGKKKIVVASILAAMAVGSGIPVMAITQGSEYGGSTAIGAGSSSYGGDVVTPVQETGVTSISIGNSATSNGAGSVAIGAEAKSGKGVGPKGIGSGSNIVNYGVAIGRKAEVTNDYGVAIGFRNKAALSATAVGQSANAPKFGASAYGVSARGYGQGAIAVGFQASAGANLINQDGSPKNIYTWDDNTNDINSYQKWGDMSVGLRALATGGNATALGRSATATAANAVAIGGGDGSNYDNNSERTQATAEKAVAIGYSAKSSATSASAFGTKASASAENAAAIGTSASASAKDTFAAGTSASATAEGATAIGKGATAEKSKAIAIGSETEAKESSATAIGAGAQAEKTDSLAVGTGAISGGTSAIAVGKDATAQAVEAVAVGVSTEAKQDHDVALGNAAKANGGGATAVGYLVNATGNQSFGAGSNTSVTGAAAVGIGYKVTASGDRAISIGNNNGNTNTEATNEKAIAIGSGARAKGNSAIAMGTNISVEKNNTTAIGMNLTANESAEGSTLIGNNSTTKGNQSISIGANNETEKAAQYSTAIGYDVRAKGKNAIAIGSSDESTKKVIAASESSIAIGTQAQSNNVAATAIGKEALAGNVDAIAIGTSAEGNAISTTAIGKGAKAKKNNAIALGTGAVAEEVTTIAIGNGSKATKENDNAFGNGSTASGGGSTAIGYLVNTTGNQAFGAGSNTTVSEAAAVGIGYQVTASGNRSISIGADFQGKKTTASAANTVAMGTGTQASATSAVAIGTNASAGLEHSVALGEGSTTTSNDGTATTGYLTNEPVSNSGNGVIAIGNKRNDKNDTGTILRRIVGLASGTNDYDAANIKQLKALESNERHIKAKTGNVAYKPDATGTITLNYVNGKGEDVTGETAEITDVAKKSDEWMLRTQDGNTTANATPQTVNGLTKKAVTLKAGDNIAIENSNGMVTIKAKNVVTSITSGNSTALTVNPSNGAVTITPNIASSVGATGEDGKLVTSGIVKTALDLKVNKTDELHVKPGNYTVGNDGDVSLIQENANSQAQNNKAFTIKDVAKKSVVDGINTTVNTHTTQISNLTTAVGGKVSQSDFDTFRAKAITFKGDDNAGVARALDTTLTLKGGANYTSTTANTNIRVEKDGSNGANGLLVKLSDKLSGMKEIAGNGSDNLVIKNGTNTVTITPGKTGDNGTVNFGDAKVVASNLEADITYRANGVADTAANTVKLKKGLNFTAATDTNATTDGPKSGLSITTGADGLVTFGLDKATRSKVDNAADKNLSNLSDDGKGKVTELAKAAAKEAVKVANGINTTVDTDTTTTAGVTTYKVNANDTTVAVTGDALAIIGGDLGTDKVRKYSLDLSDASKAKLKAVSGLATIIGGTNIAADGTVTGPSFNITKADGSSENATTLKDAIDKLNATNAGQNSKISETAGKVGTLETNVTNLGNTVTNLGNTVTNLGNTVTSNYNDLSNKITQAGAAATTAATAKGLNFTGDDTTDNGKVHRDLGETLTIKGGENFTRGANENNIKVVKNDKALDVKLAENLGNIKEIAGDGTHDLVIKNGDTKVTVKAPKDGDKGSIDFGDTKLVASNLDASIKYRANDDAVENAKSVKLADGFNYVASKDVTTTAEGPKSGLAITAEDNGKVTFGLDKATREKVDNAADKNLSNLSDDGKDKVKELAKDAAKTAVQVADGINTTVTTDTTTTAGTTIYKVNANDTTVAVNGDALAISGGTPDATSKVRAYTLDLSDATKAKLKSVDGLATVIGGTTIAANGTVTGPTFSITKADGTSENATTLKDAIDKLNATNAGQNTKISETAGKVTDLGTTVTNNYNDLSNKITQATTAATTKGLNFTGDDTTDTGKVHRDLGETLTIKGGENFTRGANESNIKVVKNDKALDVKLAENLANIKEIAGDGKTDLVIKNGDTKVTVKAPKDGNTGSIDFGDTKLVASNLDASIKYRANDEAVANAKSVKLADGFNYVASNDATTTAEGPKSGLAITAEDNGKVTFGLDKATRTTLDNAASKEYLENALTNLNSTITGNANLNFAGNVTKDAQGKAADKIGLALATGTLHVNGDNTNIVTTAKGNTITVELAQAVKDQLAKVGDTASNGRDGVNGTSGAQDLTGADGLNNATLNDKVNALRNGEAGSVVYTNEAGDRVIKAKDGKYYKADEVKADGTVKTAAENNNKEPQAVDNPQARVVNGNGDTKTATTLSNIADGKVGANSKEAVNGGQLHTVKSDLATALGGDSKVNTDGSFTGPTYNITKDDGTNGTEPVKNVGDAISKLDTRINNANSTLSTKGLDFYGNKDTADTDKVHRNLGETLKVKGAENFARAEGAKNNIDVVKNTAGDGFDVKLAENLANMKEIAGDGTHDLVIKNGDTKVTVKAPKAGNTGSIDFGDTKLVANNLDAAIKYRANDEAVANAKSVKLADGFNYVVSNDATTTAEGPKSGLAITAEDNGKVTFGLDKDTRSKVDNAADKNLSNLSDAGKEKFKELAKDAAKTAVKVADGINTTVTTDTTTTVGTTIYKVNANDTTVAVNGDALAISGGTPDATSKVRAYTLDLSDATKGKLAAVGNLANVIGGTTIATDGTVTGPTFNITKATGGTDTANTLKDAIEKLDAANQGQNTAITNLGTRITNLVDGGMTFIGDDATADKVARKLGETLNIHGQNNITVKKDGTDATTLNVKLANDLKNITSITNADADGKPGSKITLGADGVSIANTAAGADGAAGDTKTVTISKDGINAGGMKVTNVAKATENGDAANKEYVDNEITKLQTTVTNNANLNFAGNVTKDAQDKAADKVGLSLATGTLHVNGDNTNIVTTAKGDTITVELAQAVKDQLAKVGDTASNGRDGKDGVSGAKGLTGADGLNNATLNDKVNALRNGEAGSVVYTNEAGDRVVKAKDGKYYKADEVKADGTVKTADENNGKAPEALENPQARVVNGNGDTKTATTLSNIADGKVAANSKEAVNGGQLHTVKSDLATALGGDSKVNTDGSFTGPTYNITKDDGTNTTEEAKTVGDAISKLDSRINNANSSLATKGLDFYGNKDTADTDKVHRNLGETLKVKGAENFKREATATNNIDVVKNTAGDGFDVKLAENLANMKEIAGDGKTDLVIKNGDATITLKPAKPAVNDPTTGDVTTPAKPATVDFGDSNVVAKNLDASITYRANNAEDTAANTVKLKKGLNFVAGTGTVAPKNLEAGTASPSATTDSVASKKGIVISTDVDGMVNIGLDSDTRSAIDNAADKADVNAAVTNLDTRISNLVDGGMTFIGDDATADTVTRKLGETLNIHGQNNITVKKDGTDATTLNVKLASDLKNITSITNADADNKPGSKITLGGDGVTITNTQAPAAGATTGETKTVTIGKDGINAGGMNITNVAEAKNDGDATNKQYVDNAINKLGETLTNNATLNFAGNVTKDAQDQDTEKVGLSLAKGTLHVNGDNTNIVTTAKGDTITVELAQAVKDQLAKVGDTASNGRDGKDGVSGAKGLTGADGLNNATLNDKVNALRNGEAGSVVYTNEAGDRVVKAKDGKYYKADEVKADGTVKTAAENNNKEPQAVDNPQARVVNGNGDTKTATTLSNIADGKVATNSKEAVNGGQLHTVKSDLATALGGDSKVNTDGSFTGPTYNITKDDGSNTTEEAKTVGDAISKLDTRINNANSSLATKGLDFYGNKDTADTDKVHRNLGETLKVKGAENFKREATATNNIDVVKNTAGDGFDVKLAENLANMKEIAGDGKTDLVIKNGDATITLKPAKPAVNDPATGDETTQAKPATVDFGDSNVVAKNLDATITYRANNAEDTVANTVKLKKGLNFVAGTGTVAPKAPATDGTNPTAGTTTTTSPTATTDGVATKKGIAISTDVDGVVNIGLDNDTRSAIDNAANQDLSNLTPAGKKAITDAAQGAVKVAAGNNVTVDTETKDNVTTYTVNGRDTTVKAATGGSISVTGGDLNAKGEREYTVDLTDTAKAEINRIAGIDTRLTTAEGNITVLQGDMTKAKADIVTNAGNITKNAGNIATNTANIAKNAGDIATNAGNIKTNATNIATNAGNIATNTKNIATNATNIAKNAEDIATNAGNITKNAGNITTNATNIGKNAQAIQALQGNSATKDLSNLTNAGKDVVTGLVNVVGTNGITVTPDTDATSRVKTFTAKLDDKVTFGQGDKQITVDGTTGTIMGPNATINVVNTNTVQVGDTNKTNTAVTPEGVTITTKQPDGTVTSTVVIKDGTVSGLTNTKWDPTKVTDVDRSKAATQGQVKDVSDTLQKGRVFAADTGVASTTVALGDTLAIKGGAKGPMTDNNIGVELSAGTDKTPATMTVRLAKDVKMKDGSTSYNYYLPEVITKPDGTKDIAKNADGTVKYQTDKEGNPISIVTTTVNGEGITIAPVKGLNKPSVSLTADGLDNGGNAIHHVGPGTAADDAATLGQVVAATSAVSRQVNQTGAHAAALAAMNPLSYDPLKKSQVMAGYGAYKGNSALALGVAHYANEDTLFNVGVSVGNGENMVNAGMTYRFGGEDSMIPERYKGGPISSVYVMQDEITALKAENARKDAENAKKEAENEEMKAQIKMLIERVTMLEAKK
ncbi:YadA-like family protein [Veillonella sp. CHU732]|uniref:YadA-like family protein n=1 Tax=Veillonella sp. CHU732 TaxID=2490949 RepID=UPI000F8C642C|nr:YadA-like family protein [Veillonella sp. CHU732]